MNWHEVMDSINASRKLLQALCFIPRQIYADKPAVIVELKWDKEAAGAIAQIKERHYADALKDYTGNLILAGINYDRKTKKHSCVIEKIDYSSQNRN